MPINDELPPVLEIDLDGQLEGLRYEVVDDRLELQVAPEVERPRNFNQKRQQADQS